MLTNLFGKYNKKKERQKTASLRAAYLDAYKNEPIKPKTVFLEARDGDAIDGNIYYILKELLTNSEYDDFRVTVSVANDELADTIRRKLAPIDTGWLSFATVGSKKYYQCFATAEFLVNDATISNFYIKKDGQKYLNVWHGTPLKNMGRHVVHEPHAVGIAQKNFLAADYLLYPSEYMRDLMIDGYMLSNISKAKVLLCGYPRNTIFFNQEFKAQVRTELEIENKKIYVYMPTWRPSQMGDSIQEIMNEFDKKLADDEILYVKIHPLAADSLNFKEFEHIRKAPSKFETYEFLNAADALITDYSSVFFDYAVGGGNVVLYTYDEEEYLATRGLYIGLDELPFPRTATVQATLDAVRDGRQYDDSDFIKRFCPYDAPDATEKLCRLFFLGDENTGIAVEDIPDNGKPNVLVCGDDLGISENYDKVIDYLNAADRNEKNYYLLFNKSEIAPNAEKLLNFPEGAAFIGYTGKMYVSDKDADILKSYKDGGIGINELVEKIPKSLNLEYVRRYNNMRFEETVFLGNPKIV